MTIGFPLRCRERGAARSRTAVRFRRTHAALPPAALPPPLYSKRLAQPLLYSQPAHAARDTASTAETEPGARFQLQIQLWSRNPRDTQ